MGNLLVGVMRDRDGGLVLVDERFREEGGAAVEPQIPGEDRDRLSGRYPQERCPGRSRGPGGRTAPCAARSCPTSVRSPFPGRRRSEERRVGKERRARWRRGHET